MSGLWYPTGERSNYMGQPLRFCVCHGANRTPTDEATIRSINEPKSLNSDEVPSELLTAKKIGQSAGRSASGVNNVPTFERTCHAFEKTCQPLKKCAPVSKARGHCLEASLASKRSGHRSESFGTAPQVVPGGLKVVPGSLKDCLTLKRTVRLFSWLSAPKKLCPSSSKVRQSFKTNAIPLEEVPELWKAREASQKTCQPLKISALSFRCLTEFQESCPVFKPGAKTS
jgi:hypothetical protein